MFWGAKIFLKNFKKYFSNRIEKLHKMAFIYMCFFFLKKFEKVEKTGIISTKFSLRCTPSVILGSNPLCYRKEDAAVVRGFYQRQHLLKWKRGYQNVLMLPIWRVPQ